MIPTEHSRPDGTTGSTRAQTATPASPPPLTLTPSRPALLTGWVVSGSFHLSAPYLLVTGVDDDSINIYNLADGQR